MRALYELAISNPRGLDIPEAVWKAYIDFEVEEGEYDRARSLYEKLLDKTDHVKVWISFAEFEVNIPEEEEEEEEEEEDGAEEQIAERPISEATKIRGRAVFERGYRRMRKYVAPPLYIHDTAANNQRVRLVPLEVLEADVDSMDDA